MKHYVIFDEKDHHKLGNKVLNSNTIAVFDVPDREDGSGLDNWAKAKEIIDDLFGPRYYNSGFWEGAVIEQHQRSTGKIYVDINSEL